MARRARRASATGEQVDDHPRFLRALARLCITPVFTATDASWMNLTEAQFGVLQRFTLTDTDDPSHGVRQRRIRHLLRHRHHQRATDPRIVDESYGCLTAVCDGPCTETSPTAAL